MMIIAIIVSLGEMHFLYFYKMKFTVQNYVRGKVFLASEIIAKPSLSCESVKVG